MQGVRSLGKSWSFTPRMCLDCPINGMLVQGKIVLHVSLESLVDDHNLFSPDHFQNKSNK